MEMCVWDLFLNEVEYLNCAITALVIITVYWHLLSANYQELTCGVGESPPWSERLVAGPSPAWAQPKSAAWVALFNEHHVHAHECTWHLYDPFLGCSSLIKLAGVTSDLMPYAPDTWVAELTNTRRWVESDGRKKIPERPDRLKHVMRTSARRICHPLRLPVRHWKGWADNGHLFKTCLHDPNPKWTVNISFIQKSCAAGLWCHTFSISTKCKSPG